MRKDMFSLIAVFLFLGIIVQGITFKDSSEAHQAITYAWTWETGGRGGTPFEYVPPTDYKESANLNFIEAYSGHDGIHSLRFQFKKPEHSLVNSSPKFGGSGGTKKVLELENGDRIKSIRFAINRSPNWIAGIHIQTYKNKIFQCGVFPRNAYGSVLSFNKNQRIVGVKGRQGALIDRIGFLKATDPRSRPITYAWTNQLGANGGTFLQYIAPLPEKENGDLKFVNAYCGSHVDKIQFFFSKKPYNYKRSPFFGINGGANTMLGVYDTDKIKKIQIFYSDSAETQLHGIRFTTKTKKFMCGEPTQHIRSINLAQNERIVGVKGKYGPSVNGITLVNRISFLKATD